MCVCVSALTCVCECVCVSALTCVCVCVSALTCVCVCVSGPSGEWMEQPQERPQGVSVKMLDSSTAAVSWSPSRLRYNGSLISVLSLTCLRPSISQRMESTYCSEVLIHSESLTPFKWVGFKVPLL